MGNESRSIAGFFNDIVNTDINKNVVITTIVEPNTSIENPVQSQKPLPAIDQMFEFHKKQQWDLHLVGVYLEPRVNDILTELGRQGGRGFKSKIANIALKDLFERKGLI